MSHERTGIAAGRLITESFETLEKWNKPGFVAHAFNAGSLRPEAGGLWTHGHRDLQRDLWKSIDQWINESTNQYRYRKGNDQMKHGTPNITGYTVLTVQNTFYMYLFGNS